MQGRGRGQLSTHESRPVTSPATVASVTYDDPNGSWESWEPGPNWNGTGGAGHSDAPSPNAQPESTAPAAQPASSEAGMRWDEDSDTNLRHPGSHKPLPRTLITMSELDWEDTEECATELWRHPQRPRISRDQHALEPRPRPRLTARSPVRPDPRQLPMPLPGPGGARPHARSEEPTARLRVSGTNGLARTGPLPHTAPPRTLPAAPPPRPEIVSAPVEPERRQRTTTRPGAATADNPADFGAASDSSTSMPADWLGESTPLPSPYSAAGSYSERMPAEAFVPLQPSAAQASPLAGRPAAQPVLPLPSAAQASPLAGRPAAQPVLPQPSAAQASLLPAAGRPATQPVLPQPVLPQPVLPQPVLPQPVLPQPSAAQASLLPAAGRPAAQPALPQPPAASVLPAPGRYSQPTAAGAVAAPLPASASALVAPPPAGSAARALSPPASSYLPQTQTLRRGSLIQTQAAGLSATPPTQLPPAPPARPSLPAEPLTQTQSFEAHVPSAAPIESLRERTLTPPRLLPPPPPRFHSSAHIPTIIGTPHASAGSSVPNAYRARIEPQPAHSGTRLPARAAGREPPPSPAPQSHAQSQLIEQLQEQLLEAMARARVQEARAAEAEKSVEQAEEQLATVARGHSDEAEQLQQQLLQLAEQLRATEQRALVAERRPRQPDNVLHLTEADLTVRPNKQGRANLILSGLLASSLSFGGAAYFMFYAPLQKQLTAAEQLRAQDSQAHATALSNLQTRSNAERQGLEAQLADIRQQLEAAHAQAAPASPVEEGRHARGRRGGSADADSPDGTPAGTRSARAIERRMRRSSRAAAPADGEDETPRSRGKARGGRDDGNDPLGGI